MSATETYSELSGHGNAAHPSSIPGSDVRTSNMDLKIQWGHPKVWGPIATSSLILFLCISITMHLMDLTRSGFGYQLLFILSSAFVVPSFVCTVGGAMMLKKEKRNALADVPH
ncbi:MAG: hypothetical protein ACE366_11275 [Bradymonadia bacterium]